MDIFSMFLQSAFSWGVGKILDVIIECDNCQEKWDQNIGNRQFNNLGCKNCGREHDQFTNACDFTVRGSNQIAQIGARLTGGWKWHYKPYNDSIFASRYEGWVFFNKQMRIKGLPNDQVIVATEIVELDSGIVYAKNSEIYDVRYSDSSWDKSWVSVRGIDVPEDLRDNRIFAIDLKVKSKYNDLLCEDRELAQLWKG